MQVSSRRCNRDRQPFFPREPAKIAIGSISILSIRLSLAHLASIQHDQFIESSGGCIAVCCSHCALGVEADISASLIGTLHHAIGWFERSTTHSSKAR